MLNRNTKMILVSVAKNISVNLNGSGPEGRKSRNQSAEIFPQRIEKPERRKNMIAPKTYSPISTVLLTTQILK